MTNSPSAIPQTPSRRSIITAGAAAIGATAVAIPAVADSIVGDDPIFAALAEWRRLEARFDAAITVTDSVGQFSGPEYEAASIAQDAACAAVCAHERVILKIPPTTKAGALALLRFVGQWVVERVNPDDAEIAISNVVAFLEREALS